MSRSAWWPGKPDPQDIPDRDEIEREEHQPSLTHVRRMTASEWDEYLAQIRATHHPAA